MCRLAVVRAKEDSFAKMMYDERVSAVKERARMEKEQEEARREAEERWNQARDEEEKERSEILRDAELKHRQALEDQVHQQEELNRQADERLREESRRLQEVMAELATQREASSNAHKQSEIDRLMLAQAQASQQRSVQQQIDLGASVAHLRAKREAADNAINAQLHAELERSRVGPLRSDLRHSGVVFAPDGNAGVFPPELPKKEGALENSQIRAAEAGAEEEDSNRLLSFSSVALKSVAFAAASWSSQAWTLVEKLAKPLFSSSSSRLMRLGRAVKPRSPTSAHWYMDFALLTKPPEQYRVRKSIPLPRYISLSQQPTHKISREELNRNAQYFYCFREALIVSQINHPNILSHYAPLITSNESIVLEAPFIPLNASFFAAEMMVRGEEEEAMEAIRAIISHLLLATQYLHSLAIYHLNIKPSSVLIHISPSNLEKEGRVKKEKKNEGKEEEVSDFDALHHNNHNNHHHNNHHHNHHHHPAIPIASHQSPKSSQLRAYLTGFSKARARGSYNAFVSTLDLSDYAYSIPYLSPEFAIVAEQEMRKETPIEIKWEKCDLWAIGCVLMSLLSRGCDLFEGVKNASQLNERARAIDARYLREFVARSMRRRPRSSLPDLSLSPLFDHAILLATGLLQFNPNQRCSIDEALSSSFISLLLDFVRPSVLASFDDAALPTFALQHHGVPNRSFLVEED